MSPVLGIIASSISGHLTPPFDPSGFDALASITLTSSATEVVFAGIPSGYKHLELHNYVLSTNASTDIKCRFNDDAGSNYSMHRTVSSGTSTPSSYILINQTFIDCGWTGASSTTPAGTVMSILDYADTDKFKTTRYSCAADNNGGGYLIYESGNWRNTSAITSITLAPDAVSPNFSANSVFALYGVK